MITSMCRASNELGREHKGGRARLNMPLPPEFQSTQIFDDLTSVCFKSFQPMCLFIPTISRLWICCLSVIGGGIDTDGDRLSLAGTD